MGWPKISFEASFDFVVPGRPRGKERPRFCRAGSRGHAYTPRETRDYERLVADCCRHEMRAQGLRGSWSLDESAGLSVIALFPIPASWPKWKREKALRGELPPSCKPDFDNIAKAIADGLNGIAWKDDAGVALGVQIKDWLRPAYARMADLSKYPHGCVLVGVLRPKIGETSDD